MMKEKSRITKVDYSLNSESSIADQKERPENDRHKDVNLPLSFNYTHQWIISHACSNCGNKVDIHELPIKNFQTINRLYTKYYSQEILNGISKLFPSTKVFKSGNSEHHFITNSDFQGNIVSDLFIPQKTFAHYVCTNCQSEYLCQYRQGYPIEPDRGNPKGRLGIMYIDEIVQFETKGDRSFLELLMSHKKSE